ncbi:MAG TPA: hypothetical protein VEU72_01410 [Nitrosopumilaceae archaeon]|nr:hypothetical protein [Nitrosopumilaceae archaeon]
MKALHYSIIVILVTSLLFSGTSLSIWADINMVPSKANENFQLKINQTAYLKSENLKITLLNIQDSRCPSGVVCVWEGVAKAWVNILYDNQNLGNFNLTSKNSQSGLGVLQFKNHALELVDVEPYPQKGHNIALSNYSVTFMVTNSMLSPLQQFKSGIAANDIKCDNNFQLVIKSEDGSPACVKAQTAQKFVERGWGWAMQSTDSIKPLQPNKIPGLENDTGLVTLGNQTYYFETPNYTNTAYSNPMQVSFHDVVFTLFPPGFRGGLPTSVGCGNVAVGQLITGSGSYYWNNAKFSDGTHELLHIFADSPPCPENPTPTYFSNHTNPQAGLTFYDGKMKLLVSENNPKLSFMNIKVFSSYTPSSLVDHFLTGNLYSTAGPIQNGNITITVNGLVMGTAETYPNGCFQFNNWNDSKLADQINKSRSLGMSSAELTFQTQYFGDSNHNPVNASAGSYLGFYAVPLAPSQYNTSLSPSSEINITQGNFTQFHVTVKPFSKYWEVQHMKLNLQRTPCGLSYHISPVDNNDSVLVNNTASFDVVLNTTSYTPSGKYWISIDQDVSGISEPNIGAEVGAFDLNVLKK